MYLFAVVLLALVGICVAQSEVCDPEAKQRVDCGYPGISKRTCTQQRKCCWDSSTPGIPWCFYKTAKCFPYNIAKVDCGYPGISENECVEEKNCCWYPTDEENTPWCYKPGKFVACGDVTPGKRSDCGYKGITQSQCSSRGCCWDTSVVGVPWCFYNVAVN